MSQGVGFEMNEPRPAVASPIHPTPHARSLSAFHENNLCDSGGFPEAAKDGVFMASEYLIC
jgi:hypothetical protein